MKDGWFLFRLQLNPISPLQLCHSGLHLRFHVYVSRCNGEADVFIWESCRSRYSHGMEVTFTINHVIGTAQEYKQEQTGEEANQMDKKKKNLNKHVGQVHHHFVVFFP